MIKGKHRNRLLILILALLLVLSGVLGATIAFYQENTKIVKNTFVGGLLFKSVNDFTLRETEVTLADTGSDTKYELGEKHLLVGEGNFTGQKFDVLPGVNIPKRPLVFINELLLDAYLFVTVDTHGKFARTSNSEGREWVNADKTVTWSMDSHWVLLSGLPNSDDYTAVYYYKPDSNSCYLSAGYDNYDENGGNGGIDVMAQMEDHCSITVKSTYSANEKNEQDVADFQIDFKAYICMAVEKEENRNQGTVIDAWNNYFNKS